MNLLNKPQEASNISVAIRFRPLFESESKAAQWKVSLIKNSKKGEAEFHQIKLLDVQPDKGDSDPFSKIVANQG